MMWCCKQGSFFPTIKEQRLIDFQWCSRVTCWLSQWGPRKGDHVSAQRDKPCMSSGREDTVSPTPSRLTSASQIAGTAFITAAMWNYGPLHLVMKSPRSWQHAGRVVSFGVKTLKRSGAHEHKFHMCNMNSPPPQDDTLASQTIMRLNMRLYKHHGKRRHPRRGGQLQSYSGNKQP